MSYLLKRIGKLKRFFRKTLDYDYLNFKQKHIIKAIIEGQNLFYEENAANLKLIKSIYHNDYYTVLPSSYKPLIKS